MSVIFNPASATGGGVTIGGPVGGGAPNSVLFVGAGGVLAQDNANLSWNDGTTTLGVNGTSNFTGSVTAPTVVLSDNSINAATTAFVKGQGYLVGNQTITLSGDVTGSGTTAITTTYAGNLPVAKLNSGTGASSTTFWRGDGTWATPGGGGMAIGGAVTSGTAGSVLFIGGGGVLAQDNANFFWDDANRYLKVGQAGTLGAYYLNSLPALYEVANGSGNNWFEGNAGNTTVSGYQNFATGDSAMANLTSGYNNVGVGNSALHTLSSGHDNFGFGTNALFKLTSGYGNVAIGPNSLENIVTDVINTAVGYGALVSLGLGAGLGGGSNGNVALGENALGGTNLASNVIGIGSGAASGILTPNASDIYIGAQAGNSLSSTNNYTLMVGSAAGFRITGGGGCTIIGRWLGPSTNVNNMIMLAYADNVPTLDFNYTAGYVLSLQQLANHATGMHIYKTIDSIDGPTNWERGCLDWNLTSNVFRVASQAGGTGTVRLIAIDGFAKAGAPAAGDLPSGTYAVIDDTSGGQTWLAFNKAGTIRKVQLV